MFEGMHEFFKEGGAFMWIILAVGVMGVAVIVDRMLLVFRYRINSAGLWQKIEDLVNHGRVQEAQALCKRSAAPLPRIFLSGLKHAQGSERKIQNAVDEVMLEVVPELEKRIGHLTILANISTLAGLVGTIFGLKKAFAGVAIADPTQKAGMLAKGIAEALNTTALGLLIAVTILLSYSFIQSRVTAIIDEIDHFSVKLINLLTERSQSNGV